MADLKHVLAFARLVYKLNVTKTRKLFAYCSLYPVSKLKSAIMIKLLIFDRIWFADWEVS